MATKVGLTIVKQFPYRGDVLEEFSNTYHFTGAVPADAAAWKTLADALILSEKICYPSVVKTIRAYGYSSDAEDAVAVWSYDYLAAAATQSGSLTVGAGAMQAGDAAVWIRWHTGRLNTKGRPIYLRKYFHPAVATGVGVGDCDTVLAAQRTALTTHGTKMVDGSFGGGRYITSRTATDTPGAPVVSAFITTRTLKRRGKRPGS